MTLKYTIFFRKNKNKKSKDKCYIAGAFNKNLLPDIDFINHAPEVSVTFVDANVSQTKQVSIN